jgi:hypothetical protein
MWAVMTQRERDSVQSFDSDLRLPAATATRKQALRCALAVSGDPEMVRNVRAYFNGRICDGERILAVDVDAALRLMSHAPAFD